MLSKMTFKVIRDSGELFSHFVDRAGNITAIDELRHLKEAKIALLTDDGKPTKEQLMAVVALMEMGHHQSDNLTVELGGIFPATRTAMQ